MTIKRVFIKVEGIVQGVGFRPFVYNLAVTDNLKGWVNNNSEGVFIDLEGGTAALDNFIYSLRHNPPPLSRIENISIEERPTENYTEFTIRKSESRDEKITLISPDIATCEDCRKDILDPNNRRYGYPFTNCTNCGPRFSIIKSIPYDRDKTTMKKFIMCRECNDEYKNPLNRRFHAQPNACEKCGPNLWVTDSQGNSIVLNDGPIEWTQRELKEGMIFSIKGLSGFHLVCDAQNDNAVKLLRQRKRRPHKPFAVMMKDMNTVRRYCKVNSVEENLLTGIRKPIVILEQNSDYSLPQSIAPNQKTLGVMLPYTPLHELLFNGNVDVLIMTSANVYGLPLEYINESALKNLNGIVDYFLMHNRDIYIPVDDSVVKVVNGKMRMIRRARGYAPDPIRREGVKSILACGPNMKNTFCIAKEDFLFVSQHTGDLENLETFEHYKRNIEHFKNIFSFSPEYIAFDMHPNYASTEYALEYELPQVSVQHHHAHIVSCMVENHVDRKVIGISFDGTGYGTDGKIWGGEFLICDLKDFSRSAHLDYVKMPGGERAVKEPWRMAVSYIYKMLKEETASSENLSIIAELFGSDVLTLVKLIESNINSPETSSMGRFFDAVSSIVGICSEITYEGQASIELEASISNSCSGFYSYDIKKENHNDSIIYIINPSKAIKQIIEDKLGGVPKEQISVKFHNTVTRFTVDVCKFLRSDTGINDVALGGGVFQNSYLLKNVITKLEDEGFTVFSHRDLPSNDGGVSLGQIVIANEKLKCH